MKRDSKLCRGILSHVEKHDNLNFAIAGCDNRTIAGHVSLLVDEGLLGGVAPHMLTNGDIVLEDCHVHLTPQGHQFLEASRGWASVLARMRENPWLWAIGGIVGFLAALASIVSFLN
jgi:hypothetical protein